MKMNRSDRLALSAVGVVLSFLAVGSLKGKRQDIPPDDLHFPSLQAFADGRSRAEVDRNCTTCHNKRSFPLTKGHPPKEQCLICHARADS